MERADEKFMRFKLSSSLVLEEDGGSEVLRHTLQMTESNVAQGRQLLVVPDVLESELVDDSEDVAAVVEGEIKDVVADMLNSHEQQITSLPFPARVCPTVAYDEHIIYKSTLVSQLNGNSFFSKDRLTRVKHSMYFNNHDDYISAASSSSSCLLGIGTDCGVYFVQNSSDTVSSTVKSTLKRKKGRKGKANKAGNATNIMEGVDNETWWIGCVQSIRRAHGK